MKSEKKAELTIKMVSQKEDISKYPTDIHPLAGDASLELVLGDLHGNALAWVYYLIKFGIMSMNEANYLSMAKSYGYFAALQINQWDDVPKDTIKSELWNFVARLQSANIHCSANILLIGDETCDRGALDYFVLRIYEQLQSSGVVVQTLLSNHGFEFIRAYEQLSDGYLYKLYSKTLSLSQSISMLRMQYLLELGCLEWQQIHCLVKKHYFPTIQAVGYSVDEAKNQCLLHTHAPCCLSVVRALAQKFNVTFEQGSARAMAKSIDAINQAFSESLMSGQLRRMVDLKLLDSGIVRNFKTHPLEFIMWNRGYKMLTRVPEEKGVRMAYCHGHDMNDPWAMKDFIYVVDSYFGKAHMKEYFCAEIRTLRIDRRLEPVLHQTEEAIEVLPSVRNNRYLRLSLRGAEGEGAGHEKTAKTQCFEMTL